MRTTDGRRWTLILFAGIFALVSNVIAEGPAVTILQSPDAPDLEKYAGEEFTRILETLFDAKVSVKPERGDEKNVILLGSKGTHFAVREVVSDAWLGDLSGQGHLLKSLKVDGQDVLLVGGGSPVATLWAVYEFGHHFGMRYTLHEDFPPIEKPEFTIAGFDQVFESNIEVRAWRTFDPGIAGQASWGLEDHRKLLMQLAKLKFNRVVISDHPGRFAAEPISVTGDTAGRSVFDGAKVFENPDFAKIDSDDGRIKAGEALIDGINKAAVELGMTVKDGKKAKLETISPAQPKGGLLPQFVTGRLPDELTAIRYGNVEGFAVQCWIPGPLNPDVYYLSRASFDAEITPGRALDDLVTPICGEGVAARLANGFAAIEEVSALIEKEDPDFAVPDPRMFMEHFESAEPAPEWWAKATELYGTAVNEMYRGNTRARGGARPFILYHAKYFTFALHYMTAVDAARKAGIAKAAKDEAAWVENLEAAVEAMHNALGIYADVARDNSDRGSIAILNEYAYRPLVEALNEAPLP